MAPERISIPEPVTVKAPVVVALTPDIVKLPVPLEMLMIELVPLVKVKARLVVTVVVPVKFKVPPLRIILAAEMDAAPKLPETPPLPIVPTLNVPLVTVVTPV